jgi:hypothetical protein
MTNYRLSMIPNGMSDAVNLRSDVMAKLKVFFDRKPQLE